MNLIEVGILLNRSVHVLDDEQARLMRDTALAAGANPELLAAALRLRDERKAADVIVVAPKCLCGHIGWRHISDRYRCRKPGCGCTQFRAKGVAA